MKRLFVVFLVMCIVSGLGFAGWSQAEDYTIGIVLKSFSNPFWLMAKTAAEAEAEKLGVNVIILGTTTEGDYNEQVAHIEDLVTRGVDLMVVVPSEASALVPAVEAAIAKGVPVINLDSPIETDKVLGFIGSDNTEGGRMAAEFIAEQLDGEGPVAVIRGRLGNPVELQRYTGFTEGIKKYPGITLVAEGASNWEADLAYSVMEDFLVAHLEIKAVFAEADRPVLAIPRQFIFVTDDLAARRLASEKDVLLTGTLLLLWCLQSLLTCSQKRFDMRQLRHVSPFIMVKAGYLV